MEVIANGQPIPFNVADEKNLKEIIQTLVFLTNKANKLVLECKVNGEVISLLEREPYEKVAVDTIQKIELTVENKAERIVESLQEIQMIYDIFVESFTDISNALIAGQKQKALNEFGKTLMKWRQVISFLRILESTYKIKFKNIEVNGKTIDQANTELYNLLSEIKKALETEDNVSIGDLIEYELKGKIEEQKNICHTLEDVILKEAKKVEEQIQ